MLQSLHCSLMVESAAYIDVSFLQSISYQDFSELSHLYNPLALVPGDLAERAMSQA